MENTINHPHYFPSDLSDQIISEANARKLTGPKFIGQGWTKHVGSDSYGGYVVEIKTNSKNKKPIIGLVSADVVMHGSWTEGDEDCSMPNDMTPRTWITTFGKTKSGHPKWWFCDKNGNRYNGDHCSYSWNGAYSYRDPSF